MKMLRLSRTPKQGFSLTELLVVVAITAVMTMLSVPAISGLSRSQQLAMAGNQIVDLATQARQNSFSKNVMTALVLVTNSGKPELDNRAFILMELQPGATSWQPASLWQVLPRGIVIDASQSANFLTNLPDLSIPITSVRYASATLPASALKYQVFAPGGHLAVPGTTSNPTPPKVRLVEGVLDDNGALVYTARKDGSTPANYYDITLNLYTGTAKISRP